MAENKTRSGKAGNVYWVHFNKATHGKQDWFFSSQAAIYSEFTTEEIGACLEWLWQTHPSEDKPYKNALCRISKHVIYTKQQSNKHGKG